MIQALPFASPFLPNGSRIQLGEGPLVEAGSLYSIDALGGVLRRTVLPSGETENIDLRSLLITQELLTTECPKQAIGCVSPTESGCLVLAMTAGIFLFEPVSQELRFLAHPNAESATQGGRYNDGKPGPDGALYVGGMSPNPDQGGSKFFRVTNKGEISEPLIGAPPLFYPNGLHWNPTDDPNVWLLYYVESHYPAIQVYRNDLRNGEFQRLNDLISLPQAEFGFPDGMTGTDNGLLILSLYNTETAAGVGRTFGPIIVDIASSEIVERISVPVPQATSVAIGGSIVYITTGAEGYDPAKFRQYPSAGAIFSVDLSTSQIPTVARARAPKKLRFKDQQSGAKRARSFRNEPSQS